MYKGLILHCIKMGLLFTFCFANTLTFAQGNWHLPFADNILTTEQKILEEIESVELAFQEKEAAMDINLKIVQYKQTASGSLARMYGSGGKAIVMEYPFDWAVNGSRALYFNKHGELRMIKDSAHGSLWTRETYYYFGSGKIWQFERYAEVTYPDDSGTGKLSDEGQPFSKRFVFVDGEPDNEIYNENSVKEIRKELEEQSKKAAIDRSKMRYFKGELDWEYPFRMELKIEKNGNITGQYKYQKSKSSLKLEGQLTEERFEMVEKNDKGEITGRFKGRFITRTTARGFWFSPDGKTDHYFDMESAETYSFN